MRYIIISMIFGAALISACTKTEDPGTTTAAKVANEWWVNNKAGDEMVLISTYNTSQYPDSIWINSNDTTGTEYRVQAKMKVDLNELTFSTQNAQNFNLHMTNKVTITEGKILPNVGHSRTGNPTDSIFLKITYSDDPTIYTVSGHARTKWDVDDY